MPSQAEELGRKKKTRKIDSPPEVGENEELVLTAEHGDHDEAKRPARKREPPRRLADYV